jgi:hypothetical protein
MSVRVRIEALLSKLVPPPLKLLVWRLIKWGLLIAVLVGGMTAKYYGCFGGYQEVQKSEFVLFEKLSGQLSSSFTFLTAFFLLLLATSLLFVVIRKLDRN